MTVQEFCQRLMRSRLQTVAAGQAIYRQWRAVSQNPENLDSFCAWLVAKNHVTAYQAQLLREGYTDNFFLGPYRILDRIGKGRMAGVYKALGAGGQAVALKVLPPSRAK